MSWPLHALAVNKSQMIGFLRRLEATDQETVRIEPWYWCTEQHRSSQTQKVSLHNSVNLNSDSFNKLFVRYNADIIVHHHQPSPMCQT